MSPSDWACSSDPDRPVSNPSHPLLPASARIHHTTSHVPPLPPVSGSSAAAHRSCTPSRLPDTLLSGTPAIPRSAAPHDYTPQTRCSPVPPHAPAPLPSAPQSMLPATPPPDSPRSARNDLSPHPSPVHHPGSDTGSRSTPSLLPTTACVSPSAYGSVYRSRSRSVWACVWGSGSA